jgi:hypothetical protein
MTLPLNLTAAQYQAAPGAPIRLRPPAADMDDLQRQIDGFLARHPIPEDLEKTRRLEAILLKRKLQTRRAA